MEYTDKPGKGDFNANGLFDVNSSPFDVNSHMIFSCTSGSRAYGMETESSDWDHRGILIAPGKYYYGLSSFEQVENQSKDVCYFDIKKWAYLAYQNNPHALELLAIPEDCVNFSTSYYDMLKSNLSMFLSKKIGFTFGGYAHQQLMTMRTKISNNTGRQELIQKHGYDPKLAAHALRLYRMGYEVLTDGVLNVRRPDAKELKEVRAGKYTYEEMCKLEQVDGKKWVLTDGILKYESDKFELAWKTSKLSDVPNFNKIEELVMQVHSNWRNR